MNVLNLLVGRKLSIYGTLTKGSQGVPVPAMAIVVRHRWFHTEVDILDCISFLVVAEKVNNLTNYNEDFVYDQMHGKQQFKLSIPAWATKEAQQLCLIHGRKLFDWMKRADSKMLEEVNKLAAHLTDETKEALRSATMMDRYRELHAQVNNYPLVPENKTLQ